jgi:hypothetical protein
MVDRTPETVVDTEFPYIDPLFTHAKPDEVVQWTWVLETMALDEDIEILDRLGIEGEVREELQAHMTLSRAALRSMIERGVGFDDSDITKTPRMMAIAHDVIDAYRNETGPNQAIGIDKFINNWGEGYAQCWHWIIWMTETEPEFPLDTIETPRGTRLVGDLPAAIEWLKTKEKGRTTRRILERILAEQSETE